MTSLIPINKLRHGHVFIIDGVVQEFLVLELIKLVHENLFVCLLFLCSMFLMLIIILKVTLRSFLWAIYEAQHASVLFVCPITKLVEAESVVDVGISHV